MNLHKFYRTFGIAGPVFKTELHAKNWLNGRFFVHCLRNLKKVCERTHSTRTAHVVPHFMFSILIDLRKKYKIPMWWKDTKIYGASAACDMSNANWLLPRSCFTFFCASHKLTSQCLAIWFHRLSFISHSVCRAIVGSWDRFLSSWRPWTSFTLERKWCLGRFEVFHWTVVVFTMSFEVKFSQFRQKIKMNFFYVNFFKANRQSEIQGTSNLQQTTWCLFCLNTYQLTILRLF